MRRSGLIGFCVFALAIWAQILAPLAAERMDAAFDPLAVICVHGDHRLHPAHGAPSHGPHEHHCCPLCHAYLGGAPLDDRPVYTRLDFPVSSPLRWRLVVRATTVRRPWRAHRPRDPPVLA